MKKYLLILVLSCLSMSIFAQQQNYELVVNVNKVGAKVQPYMYGLFFEDINFGADGGLYAELIKNRSFDFPQSLMGWASFGNVTVKNEDGPFDRNPNYIRLSNAEHGHKHTGVENEGFRGIGLKKDATYRFSVWARSVDSNKTQKISVEFIDAENNPFERKELEITSTEWEKYEVVLTSPKEEEKASLRIFLTSEGPLDLEHISLFPTDTWKERENGLRRDLVEALDELNPGLFRFPGGCIVEGTDLETRYDWKKSIGQVENRPLNENRWHYTFSHRLYPDYFQTYGMGFYELFLLSEDIGAEPLPVVNAGLACQYQNNGEHCHVPVGELGDYIQDALDLIEFANGDITTEWGKVRAEMGHPEPFNMKFIGIGNEQWGPEYPVRLEKFIEAIRAKYPEIKIIGSSGPQAEGEDFEYLWPEMKRLKVDLVDEHYYRSPEWFLSQADRYDSYDRKGPKVFAGEYASHHRTRSNNWESALTEASFMTGLERNADIVHMATYAPLLAHVEAWQWRPDLIWFDNLRVARTPNYYVQKIYAHNSGTNVLPITWNKKPLTGQENLYASSVIDTDKKEIIIKLSNASENKKNIIINLDGIKRKITIQPTVEYTVFKGDLNLENSLDNPETIIPETFSNTIDGAKLNVEVDSNSFNMWVVKYTD